jgi:hypothetical protein
MKLQLAGDLKLSSLKGVFGNIISSKHLPLPLVAKELCQGKSS